MELLDPVFGTVAVTAATDDRALLDALCETETALARACARVGLVPLAAALEVGAACEKVRGAGPARRVVILEDLVDHGNVGAIFRCAAALGVDAVILSPRCADPLYRRAIKVSASILTSDPWQEACQVLPYVNTLTRMAATQAYDQAGVAPSLPTSQAASTPLRS